MSLQYTSVPSLPDPLDPTLPDDQPIAAAEADDEAEDDGAGLDLGLGAPDEEAARAAVAGVAATAMAGATRVAAPATALPDAADGPVAVDPGPVENGSGTGTFSVGATGNQAIDGILAGVGWSGGYITYSDPDSRFDYQSNHPEAFSNFGQVSAQQMLAVHAALNSVSYGQPIGGAGFSVEGFTNLTLDYAGSGSGAGTIRVANTSNPGTAYAYYPSTSPQGGDAFFGNSGRFPTAGNYDYHTVIHELGHALGLKHGQETGVYGALPYDWDSMEFSVMTYRSHVGSALSGYTNETWGYAQSFMMLDIPALQHIYGANFSINSGNTTYTWSATSGESYVNGALAIDPGGNRIFSTIWDGGGYDTYDLSNYATNLRIDLSPGGNSTFSSAQLAYLGDGVYARGNVFNALQYAGDARSLIEAAIGGSGHDTIYGNAANNALYGNAGNDYLWGGSGGNDFLSGGDGDDTLNGGGGSDTCYGGNGNDYIYASVGTPETIVGGAGVDTLDTTSWGFDYVVNLVTGATNYAGESFTEMENIVCGAGNDTLYGTAGANYLYAGAGNDVVQGNSGADSIYGATGNDTLYGEAGADYLNGGDGDDVLVGGDGNDVLDGGGGSDAAYGEGGDDYIYAVLGTPETIDGGSGVDTLDTAYYSFDYVVNLATGLTNWIGESFLNMENLISGVGNDTLTGTSGANVIRGGAGNDVINGGGGNDQLRGEDGADTLLGGSGADNLDGGAGIDSMNGGTGNDTYVVDAIGDVAAEAAGGGGVDRVLASVNHVLGANIENLTLTGTAIDGRGNTLANQLVGNASNNTLIGYGGSDVLRGLDGNDFLAGDVGADELRGGLGADRFDFNVAAHSSWTAFDVIVADGAASAFQGAGVAGGDVIDLSTMDANDNVAGNQAFVWNSTAVGGLSLIDVGDVTRVRGNISGASGFEFRIDIHDGATVAADYFQGDFVL
ncbi:M10 family metallopeptidase [Amaricoccus sp.]|uniref:M10 family metallopeptidase n=1 Tax=Amaricoccus sp. TaxID=1872485 RepID=UPI001B69BFF9|nr:M10 family metallopeptidase [Amaricoccus sp.]MBP7000590.1 M10 family metallopeptidase C-terminal domain-containing protein [Amaricoccus sp.]